MQTVIVILIVAVAAIYLFRRFYGSISKESQSTCGCGCDGCSPSGQQDGCSESEKPFV